jgi:hypothetical protein
MIMHCRRSATTIYHYSLSSATVHLLWCISAMSNEKEMNRLKELLRRRDKVILEQAQEIAELKQKLLRRATTSAQQSTECKNKKSS